MLALRVSEDELRALLVERLEIIDTAEFEKAKAMATRLRVPIERAVVERGRIPLGFLLEQLAELWGVGFLDLDISDVDPTTLSRTPEEYARRHMIVPFAIKEGRLHVAMWDPRDREVIDELERTTWTRVVPYLAPEMAIRRAHLLYRADLRLMLGRALDTGAFSVKLDKEDDGSATETVNRILEYAATARASDIHIEPYELEGLVRYRIDGVLHEVLSVPTDALVPIVARIKLLSQMRIDERRAPQDGRFDVDLGGYKVDLRVSAMPTHWGEKLVLRVLAKSNVLLDLEDLGLSSADYAVVLRNVTRPHGMVLVTGPTGCGKTTSLYAMMIRLGAERQHVVNISSIEDPVEYTIPRVNQVHVNPGAGLGFASGLRALLRQDPDIIMVGEIRDLETAEIAVRSALVGRLLISTLHTNDATGAVPRLLDMGIEPFLVASTLSLVAAQRLVRRICTTCRESTAPDPTLLKVLYARADFAQMVQVLRTEGVIGGSEDPFVSARVFRGKGCVQCGGTGFRSRLGIFELFEVTDAIREMIMDRKDATVIRAEATRNGMKTMFQDGIAKALLGETTLEEVFRVAL